MISNSGVLVINLFPIFPNSSLWFKRMMGCRVHTQLFTSDPCTLCLHSTPTRQPSLPIPSLNKLDNHFRCCSQVFTLYIMIVRFDSKMTQFWSDPKFLTPCHTRTQNNATILRILFCNNKLFALNYGKVQLCQWHLYTV